MGCREQRSHVRGVHSTYDISYMRTVRVKQEKEADQENGKKSGRNVGMKENEKISN